MRRILGPTAAVGGALAAVLLSAGPALAAPAVTVSPSSGLSNGSTVHVKFTGFKAGDTVAVVECSPLAATKGSAACDTGSVKIVTADANGAGETDYTVKTGQIGTLADSKCPPATDSCVITAALLSDNNTNGFAPITFATATTGGSTTGGSTTGGATTGGSTTGGSTTGGAVAGGTSTDTGKPFGLELGLGAALVAAGLGAGGFALRRRVHA